MLEESCIGLVNLINESLIKFIKYKKLTYFIANLIFLIIGLDFAFS